MQFYDGFTSFDETIYFGFEVEPVLFEGVLYRFVFVVGYEVEHPTVQVLFYHWVRVYLLDVRAGG